MTTVSHSKGSERSHSRRTYVKVKSIENMSEEEIDRDKAKISFHLHLLMDML